MTQFVNHLAVQRKVAASTQTQALNALVFLYRDVLVVPLGEMSGLNRVQQRQRIPVVMRAHEVSAVLSQMSGTRALMAQLMFGSGLRVEECCTLRVKDIDFGSSIINVHAALSIDIVLHLSKVGLFPRDYVLPGIGRRQLAALPNGVDFGLNGRQQEILAANYPRRRFHDL